MAISAEADFWPGDSPSFRHKSRPKLNNNSYARKEGYLTLSGQNVWR